MECPRASSLLSQYIDGDLSPEVRRMMDEHLAGCEKCSSELREIARTVETLGSLERIAAPQGFLARVHTRVDESTLTRRFFRSLFSPIHVKLPLEAIGAGIAVLLVVFAHQGTVSVKEKAPGPHRSGAPAAVEQPAQGLAAAPAGEAIRGGPRSERGAALQEETAPAPEPMAAMKAAESAPRQDIREGVSSPSESFAPAAAREKKQAPAPLHSPAAPMAPTAAPSAAQAPVASASPMARATPAAPKAPASSTAQAKFVQLALLIRLPSGPQEAARRFSAAATAPAQRSSAASLPPADDRVSGDAAEGGGPSAAPGRALDAPQQQTKPLLKRSASPPASRVRKHIAGDPAEAVARIERWAADTGGSVREKELVPGTSIPKSIVVEIPVSSYTAFVEGLQHIGSLRAPYPKSPPSDVKGVVPVRITLLSPE